MWHKRISLFAHAVALMILVPAVSWAGSEKVLYTFTGGADGGTPQGGVIFDGSGSLYGTAEDGAISGCFAGCGTVFQLAPVSGGEWTYNVLYSFPGGAGGGGPAAGLLFDPSANLYGTAPDEGTGTGCGTYGCGVAFELTPGSSGWTGTVLYDFTAATGSRPEFGLILDKQGNLYGTNPSGGGPWGTVFELLKSKTGGWHEKLLHVFAGNPDGAEPGAPLVSDAVGNLYGTASSGGTHNGGTAFELSAGGGQYRTIYNFGCKLTGGKCKPGDGRKPFGALIFDKKGNLYGTTTSGGGYRAGTVFELSMSGGKWHERLLYSFKGGSDGKEPSSAPIFDASGNLYGITGFGGDTNCNLGNGCGTVFKLTPPVGGGSWKKKILYVFAGGSDGLAPSGGLVMDATGNLYGTTAFGGQACPEWGSAGCGVVFEITP